jgi:hypothetical protein
VDTDFDLTLAARPLDTQNSSSQTFTVRRILLPCNAAALAQKSQPLSTAFSCSDGVLDSSKALTQAFTSTCVPLSTVIELVHELHNCLWMYNARPVSEVLDTLGYVRQMEPSEGSMPDAAASEEVQLKLHAVKTADLGRELCNHLGKHWLDECGSVAAGDTWVRTLC